MVWRWWWCDSSPHDVHVPLLFLKCGPCGVFGGFVWKFDYFDIPDVSIFVVCLWMVDCYASALLCYDSVLGGVPWGFCGCFLLCYEDCVSQVCLLLLCVAVFVMVIFVFRLCLQDVCLDAGFLLCRRWVHDRKECFYWPVH